MNNISRLGIIMCVCLASLYAQDAQDRGATDSVMAQEYGDSGVSSIVAASTQIEPFSVPNIPKIPDTPKVNTPKDVDKVEDNVTKSTESSKAKSPKVELSKEDAAIGLKELISRGLNNQNLEAKDIAILQAKAMRTGSYGEFLPTLDGSYQLQNTNNTYIKAQAQSASAKANWEIFSGFKGYNKAREKGALYNASIADRMDTKEQIFLSIVQSYYAYFSNMSTFASLNQKINSLNENKKRVQTLYDVGLTTIDELESIKAEIASTQYSLESTRLEIEKNRFMLELLTNSSIEDIKRDAISNPEMTSSTRQDIIKLEYQSKALLYTSRQITYLPSVSIFDTYTWNQLDSMSNKDGSALNPFVLRSYPKNQNIIGVSVSMRIFDGFSLNRQRESARLNYLQNEKLLAYKKAEQDKDLKVYKRSLDIAQDQIKASKAGLDSASIAFENVKKKYQSNILNFTDYLTSLTRKFEAQAQYNASLNNYEIQKAFYIYYSGQSLETYIK